MKPKPDIKERDVEFPPQMIKELLCGRKTQHRWLINPQPDLSRYYLVQQDYMHPDIPKDEAWLCEWDGDEHNGMELHQRTIRCPYGKPGDLMWVKPRRDYRIVLEIIDVHAEQLNDVTAEDAEAEGITPHFNKGDIFPSGHTYNDKNGREHGLYTPIVCYSHIWEVTHGEGSWQRDLDSWVWAVTFKPAVKFERVKK